MVVQLSMFREQASTLTDNDAAQPRYSHIHVSESTFLAGLSSRIHRWFRLTPSFGPDLVHEMLESMGADDSSYILDPFSGAGTTAIETSLEGFDSIGFEINPLLQFVNRASLNWSLDETALNRDLTFILEGLRADRKSITLENLEKHGLTIPPIHNPFRWWRADVLLEMIILKKQISGLRLKSHRDFFMLTLAGVLVPDLTNVTLGRLQLHFIKREKDHINVEAIFANHASEMIGDLKDIHLLSRRGKAEVHLQDATKLAGLTLERKVDCIVTSPPYPNRYSYVWNTRPHLYMLDIIKVAKEASDIDRQTIGGTWGTATSELMKGVIEPFNKAVADVIGPTVLQIRKEDNLMANYAMHYFNRLAKHIVELEHIVSPEVRVAYVVGNSWLKGVYVETDVLLGKLFEALDLSYTVRDVHRFRKRHSGVDLYESIVYAAKSRVGR